MLQYLSSQVPVLPFFAASLLHGSQNILTEPFIFQLSLGLPQYAHVVLDAWRASSIAFQTGNSLVLPITSKLISS